MKIALAIFKYFPFGGLQNDMLFFAKRACERGHEITIFTSEWCGERPEEAGIRVVLLPRRGFMNFTRAENFERDLADILKKEKFDCSYTFNRIGNCDFYFAGDACLVSAWKNKSFLEKMLPRCRTFLAQERRVFEGNTHIFYLVPGQKKDYQEVYHVPDSRFTELPPGIGPRYFHFSLSEEERRKKRAELGIAPGEIMLLLAAANPMLKGLDRIVKAVGSLPEKLREKCRIYCAGASRLPGRSAPGRVLCGGPRKDMPQIYACADLLVHPARAEASGTVLIESICCGTPVIASGICGFAPYVKASGGIVLKEPFSQEELDRVLEKALETLPSLREKVRSYPEKDSFFRRADVCLDRIEQFRKMS